MVKWELDLWYEFWDRAGSQGFDTWYDPRAARVEEKSPAAAEPRDATDVQPEGA